jgi:DNA replication protein DnaC
MAIDFGFGAEPQWLKCKCGALSAIVPCWECDRDAREARARAEAQALAADELPRRYRWAQLGHADLARRVKLPGDLTVREVASRVLGASRVVLSGPSGSGKTSLGVACLRERLPGAMWVSALALGTTRIRHSAGDGSSKLEAACLRAPLLLIDELGGEQKGANNAVKDVIFGRYDDDLPTWITTGFGSKEIVAMYGDGALRRLTEGGYVLKLGGEA